MKVRVRCGVCRNITLVDVDDSRPFRSPEYYQILTQILKEMGWEAETDGTSMTCLLYTSPSPRDRG